MNSGESTFSRPFGIPEEWEPVADPTDSREEHQYEDEQQEARSLYSLLNVSPEASTSDIQRSHRDLATALHPDKHPEHLRAEASARFQHIQRAYEVLSNEHTRRLYDAGGEELLASGMKVGPRVKSVAELRQELEQRKQLEQIKSVNALVRARASVTVALDASQVFAHQGSDDDEEFVYAEDNDEDGDGEEEGEQLDQQELEELLARLAASQQTHPGLDMFRRLSNIWVTSQALRSTFNVPINPATRFTFVGRSSLSASRAGANYMGTLEHQHSDKLSLSLSSSLFTASPTLVTKAQYRFNAASFAEASATLRSRHIPPSVAISTGTSIYPGWTSFASFRSGQYTLGSWGYGAPMSLDSLPAFTVGLSNQKGIVVTTETSIRHTTLALQWAQIVWGDCRVKLATVMSSRGGFSVNCEGEAKGPFDTTNSVCVGFGTSGVLLKLQTSRLGQSVSIPITLSHELSLPLALSFILFPSVSFTAAQYWVLQPRKRRRKLQRLAELRKEHAQALLDRRIEAESERRLLEDQASRRRKSERNKSGLVILTALYGPLKGEEAPGVEAVDVSVPLQALISGSQLILPGGPSKSGMLGFCDPCPGIKKCLFIEYEFGGARHRTTCGDKAGLMMPLKEHATL